MKKPASKTLPASPVQTIGRVRLIKVAGGIVLQLAQRRSGKQTVRLLVQNRLLMQRETSRQLEHIIGIPISDAQREKAAALAAKAQRAANSPITAKFRKSAIIQVAFAQPDSK